MDLALNNLQRLICHKNPTQPTNRLVDLCIEEQDTKNTVGQLEEDLKK